MGFGNCSFVIDRWCGNQVVVVSSGCCRLTGAQNRRQTLNWDMIVQVVGRRLEAREITSSFPAQKKKTTVLGMILSDD